MTLVSSGNLWLKGSSGDPTRSIYMELYGSTSVIKNLSTCFNDAIPSLSPGTNMSEFYGHTQQELPPQPTNAHILYNSSTDVLTGVWSHGTDTTGTVDYYRVEKAIDTGSGYGSWTFVGNTSGDVHSMNLNEGCQDNKKVKFRVRSHNNWGDSGWAYSTEYTFGICT